MSYAEHRKKCVQYFHALGLRKQIEFEGSVNPPIATEPQFRGVHPGEVPSIENGMLKDADSMDPVTQEISIDLIIENANNQTLKRYRGKAKDYSAIEELYCSSCRIWKEENDDYEKKGKEER